METAQAPNPGVLSPSRSSEASYDYLSARTDYSSVRFSDDDEIVWSVSDLSLSSSNDSVSPRSPACSEDDFVLLRPSASGYLTASSSPSSASVPSAENSPIRVSVEDLSNRVSSLYLGPYDSPTTPKPPLSSIRAAQPPSVPSSSPKKRSKKKRTVSVSSSTQSSTPAVSAAKAVSAKKLQQATNSATTKPAKAVSSKTTKKAKKAAAATSLVAAPVAVEVQSSGLGNREVVDDVSEAGDYGPTAYHDAVQYISSSLSNPSEKSTLSNLRLLQALIIELGLCPSALRPSGYDSMSFPSLPSLPNSLRAAKMLLKSSVFLNVRDYLDVRGQGLDALRRVMHPSRKALMHEVRKKGKRMPVGDVKGMGLNVLLVRCY
ncbi:hypothetical protein SCP_0408280 [Sparassis crispa]|uniref:Uncharacterized protein n=1 Tax=Sparassis crispa TaxID=139825 RepID=A0A401GJW9_9APHY|nr:hypothetical protein SCP_0408280 [Sparassis crispa]GBE82444.1 hypothetical protein SCP_0408280 [Sparassis crispa]